MILLYTLSARVLQMNKTSSIHIPQRGREPERYSVQEMKPQKDV